MFPQKSAIWNVFRNQASTEGFRREGAVLSLPVWLEEMEVGLVKWAWSVQRLLERVQTAEALQMGDSFGEWGGDRIGPSGVGRLGESRGVSGSGTKRRRGKDFYRREFTPRMKNRPEWGEAGRHPAPL